jgi:hypothetical protein
LEEHFELRAANRDGNRRVLTQKLCSKDNAIALLKTSEIRKLPPIQRVLTNPVFVEGNDGELIVLNQGYHPENGGTYVLSGTEITETISIEEAVTTLRGLFSDFNFLTQSDESRGIAGLISPALRFGALLKADFPIDLCEADLSQTGKSYRTEIISEVYGEIPFFITSSSEKTKGVGSQSEDISGAVMSGKGIVIFDNMRGVLDSPLLESAVRGGRMIQARVPHIEGKQLATDHIIWMATSNQAQTTPDLANRSVITRLRKQKPGYKFKMYNGLSLLEYVKKGRGYILSCIFAVVREWHRKGKPINPVTEHDFREWCGAMDWIVQSLFHLPPLLEGHRAEQSRLSSPGRSLVRDICVTANKKGKLGIPLTATNIAEIFEEEKVMVRGGKVGDDIRDIGRRIGIYLKPVFEDSEEVPCGEFTLIRLELPTRLKARQEFRPVKHYKVIREEPEVAAA